MVQRPLGNHHYGPDTLLVTSDTADTARTERAERAAALNAGTGTGDAAGDETGDEAGRVRELVAHARYVLWDFDGPVCSLFSGHSAEQVATDLVRWLEGRGLRGLVTEEERKSLDPHVVLRAVDARHPGSDLVTELEERLTKEELRATSSAMPTAYADPLIRTWSAMGVRLAVATNNAPVVVRQYLTGRGLLSCFAPHIYGRTQNLHLLKPHPYCLSRGLSAMGAAPTDALMIGDTPSDFHAAKSAGVPFLGYARNEDKEKLLRDAGATSTVRSLLPVLRALSAS
ncbi:HAD family hydrolase [Streptomyces griseiscabiei]|uniref:HAD hydrolase-like protein n=1 Tax=Streptomyces griseiscabiei TaxID=2993540 RepID=A0ABU4LI33_9ACTN|nr:HAD family hydrolase [Streptomyces griseiscabiei]MBZ3907868.1 HAD family hydrolase [Streptomyces griseiscabiei]MDX2915238.1 HAD hydrolase-like protein [Streptomyces griseiscabiei]